MWRKQKKTEEDVKKVLGVICIGLIFLLFAGCATIQPKFEDSNQLFIERTVDNLDLGNVMKKNIPSGSKVAIVSLEKEITLDKPIIALIEDQLIQSLMSSGFKVLERDQNAVENLMKENAHSDVYSLLQNNSELLKSKRIEVELSEVNFTPFNSAKTNIQSADYLINYRILECGIVYRDYDSELDKREGLVRLHIRVQKTNNGEIVSAQNLDGKKEDTIKKELVTQLADFHYSYFPYDYPLQPKQKKERVEKKKGSSDSYFYFAPSVGMAFGYDVDFAFGGTIGWGSKSIGRIGANYTNAIENGTFNYTLQYEKPISTGGIFYLTPKIGAGFISDRYESDYEDEWDEDESRWSASFGLVLGGAVEFDISKPFIFKVGYDLFLGLGEDEASSGAILATFGFRM